ncbi:MULTISPECIES: hypothetical protein [Streptomyces]|uniref:TrbL/VirB6 plasmid conjugal transfer protein n=1 Tax=Streptomyces lichenis TaxID=2306967 RepID=A0ABT0IA64_9ACTN|nr:hypothetical protein [Streptomyces lichenis]MCK8678214.1 hypothetical protein [Streptomyces lichenis]
MACAPAGGLLNPVGFFSFLGDPIGTILSGIANAVLSAAINVFGALTTGIPTLSVDGAARDVGDQTQWIVVYTAVASLLVAAARMALERRAEAGQTALRGLIRVVLVAGAATAVAGTLASLSDRFADHLFAAGAQEQVASIGCDTGNAIEAFLLLVLAFLLLIAGIVHTILLFVRLGVMILLLGTLPLAAAASMTDWGGGWWRKHLGWMIAWLLYKPAAALVLFAGSAMISPQGNSGVSERIAGIGVMLLSAIALPALLKLVVPATAALGTGGAMGGMSGAAGATASGAKAVASAALPGQGAQAAPGPMGAAGAGGAAGTSGVGGGQGAAAAAGPAGAAGGGSAAALKAAGGVLGAVAGVAQGAARNASGAVRGADGEAGHNR